MILPRAVLEDAVSAWLAKYEFNELRQHRANHSTSCYADFDRADMYLPDTCCGFLVLFL